MSEPSHNNSSGGNPSTSKSSSDNDDIHNTEVESSSTISMSDGHDSVVLILGYSSNSDDESDSDMHDSVYGDNSMDQFTMFKMQYGSRPCYDDIKNDRIAGPVADSHDKAPVADTYDEAPVADSCDEPPPSYDAIHQARPGVQRTLNPSLSSSNEVVPPNNSTVTEVTLMTTSSVVIKEANKENIVETVPISSSN